MLTASALRAYTYKDLAQMAKQRGVQGWHSMRKDELVRALVNLARRKSKTTAKRNTKSKSSAKKSPATSNKGASAKATNGKAEVKPKSRRVARRIKNDNAQRESRKDLASPNGHAEKNGASAGGKEKRARIVLMVRDPYWLHAHWEITRACVDRARAALAEQWHTAKPVLRLIEVDAGTTTTTTDRVAKVISIHGGVQNWYIDVPNPPQSYVIEIGYLAEGARFHSIARSNMVTTPRPGSRDTDQNWDDVAENCEKIYAMSGGYSSQISSGDLQQMFEERFKRPMGSPMNTRYGLGAERYLNREREFELQVDAEMLIFGVTKTDAYLTLAGEPLKVGPDGSFSVRMELGNQRQVLPIVSESADGVEQRTIVIAVERNTKVMEPVIRDPNEM